MSKLCDFGLDVHKDALVIAAVAGGLPSHAERLIRCSRVLGCSFLTAGDTP